jgi:hypothetical protein
MDDGVVNDAQIMDLGSINAGEEQQRSKAE